MPRTSIACSRRAKHCDRLELWITAHGNSGGSPWRLEVRLLNPRRLHLKVTDAQTPLCSSEQSEMKELVLCERKYLQWLRVMQSWVEWSPYCIGLNVCLGTFASFDHSVLYFPILCEGSINWHLTRVTPSGKCCKCSSLLVSAVSIHPFSITVLRLLEPTPALLSGQVTRGQGPGHNHWQCPFTPAGNPGSSV